VKKISTGSCATAWDLEWETLMQIVPPDFQKHTAQKSPKHAISSEFFLQRGLSPSPDPCIPLDPIPCPNQALWIGLRVPRIAARFTSKRARSVLREKSLNKFKGSGGAGTSPDVLSRGFTLKLNHFKEF